MKNALSLLLLFPLCCAADPLSVLQEEGSVQDNIRAMDSDHDGMVTMAEIKAYLQKQYGSDYKKNLLQALEARAEAKSCGSPFSRPTF